MVGQSGRRLCLLFGVCLLVVGCGKGDGPKLVSVQGKVIFDNAPLKSGLVIFHPDKDRGNESLEVPHGEIDADGNYNLMTRAKPGAAPGWYKIAVHAAETKPNDPYFTKWLIPDKYVKPEASKLAREVVLEPEPGRYDLKLDK